MSAEPMDDLLALPAIDTVEALLLSAAGGDQAAFVALKVRMSGLVRVNVRRVLHDASRSDTATQETFAEVLEEAFHFDPDLDTAATWLLTRAHQHAMEGLRSGEETAVPQRSKVDECRPVLLA